MKNEITDKEQKLSPLITDKEKQELFRELTTILTRRWIKDNVEVFGVSQQGLLIVTRVDIATLENILEEYKIFISILGLELVNYKIVNETWLCLKSNYFAPPELNEVELIVLGIIVGLRESGKKITTKKIKEFLTSNDYLKEYIVSESIRSLTYKGYIKRKSNLIDYNYRTLLEFDEDERTKIKEEYEKL
ncbi:MAG: hypothetical protein K9W46_06210 [Candidatus Heimdallarchaeum endolithica]|uniref:Uncharacterized protein n=1 Tax=Candidatus Heimdallarchaeum endolithica TaxID=2876572 RepID=A0A9Y1FPE7_9ARCH|nr:MAG: hypothetical protein K9W46_06210 [Candidatus Heimdallarchaeum endolithica]